MEKQFEAFKINADIIKKTKSKKSELEQQLLGYDSELKKMIVETYDNSVDVMYLVVFDVYMIRFIKATKHQLHTVSMSWYNDNTKFKKPKDTIEATLLLDTFKNPTNCEISSYETFGYFDDIDKEFMRIDWIKDSLMNNKIPYETTYKYFKKALDTTCEFYS
jgi:hypothetical protein